MAAEKENRQYQINATAEYYCSDSGTPLGWEWTVCNMLHAESGPCRKILQKNASYGALLREFLQKLLPFKRIKRIIEIGGGYGHLMRDFLDQNHPAAVCMSDISPFLLNRQREQLKDYGVEFHEGDFLTCEPGLLAGRDLAILNENLGDFPTVTQISRNIFQASTERLDPVLREVRFFFDQYELGKPGADPFHFNLGALQAAQKLCASGIPYIFMAEHSCEAQVPADYADCIRIHSAGLPEKISLHGHAEYSIQFSHLEKLARCFRYRTVRGPLADFIKPDFNDALRSRLRAPDSRSDETEMIRHFVEDLFKYEYLVLAKEPAG